MNILPFVSRLTRFLNFKGMERLLTLFYGPDKRTGNFFKTIMDYEGGRIQINTSSYLEWVTYFKGHYEPQVTKFIKSIIAPDSVSIDAGANIGLHAIEMSKGKKVYTFEPNPLICKRLKENLALSKITNVEVMEIGLSNTTGALDFHIPLKENPNQGLGSLYESHVGASSEKIQVKIDTIDNLFPNLEKLNLIKIDVEGHDFNVILGASKTIERLRPVVIFEFCKEWGSANHAFSEARDFFFSKNYTLSVLDGKPCGRKEIKEFTEIVASPN